MIGATGELGRQVAAALAARDGVERARLRAPAAARRRSAGSTRSSSATSRDRASLRRGVRGRRRACSSCRRRRRIRSSSRPTRSRPPSARTAFIERHGPAIEESWYEEARFSVSARALTRDQVTHGISQQLAALARLLSDRDCSNEQALPPALVEAYVSERIRQGYELSELVQEYALLERCTYKLWSESIAGQDQHPTAAFSGVHVAVDTAIRLAISIFIRYAIEEGQAEKGDLGRLQRIASGSAGLDSQRPTAGVRRRAPV